MKKVWNFEIAKAENLFCWHQELSAATGQGDLTEGLAGHLSSKLLQPLPKELQFFLANVTKRQMFFLLFLIIVRTV